MPANGRGKSIAGQQPFPTACCISHIHVGHRPAPTTAACDKANPPKLERQGVLYTETAH